MTSPTWRALGQVVLVYFAVGGPAVTAQDTQPGRATFAEMIAFARLASGTGWHVIIRYPHGHERRIDGFASRSEAVDWIVANASQLDEWPDRANPPQSDLS